MNAQTPWEHGNFDAKAGKKKILFGRMYEDPSIELAAFPKNGRVFCIASAGCTAMKLAPHHQVVAIDINPDQLAYAARRIAGEPAVRGTAERVMAFGRGFAPLVGWSKKRVRAFLELDDPAEQLAFWQAHLDTRRFRFALDTLFSVATLRAVYASPFLAFLPKHLGAVMRGRMERCISSHGNAHNPYARLLLLGELEDEPPPPEARDIQLVAGDAAAFLESQPAGSFDGFTISNVLDGAGPDYRQRLHAAIRHAARPGAVVVSRSFGEASELESGTNHAAEDRAMLWGVVDVRGAASLQP